MKFKKFSLFYLLMLALIIIALAGGGCGGGSSSSGSSNDQTTNDQTNNNNNNNDNNSNNDNNDNNNNNGGETSSAIAITLSGTSASINGSAIKIYDYVWHASPSVSVDYYTEGINGAEIMSESEVLGEIAADGDALYNTYGVYIARDVHYMPNNLNFNQTVKNDDETEYACYYDSSIVTEARAANPNVTYSGNIIFATMPKANSINTMTFSANDAYSNPVLHITKPGIYELSGTWSGQIWIDASTAEKPKKDTSAKVTLILNGVNVTCAVAPALVFHNVYEIGPDDEDDVEANNAFLTLGKNTVTSSNAGAVIRLASSTTNNFTGKNLYRILSVNPKKESVTIINGTDIEMQKKRWKIDGAFYSFVSMVIEGNGTLNVTSTTYEGLDTEMHLSINGGTITINAPDDGINVNEDDTSVFTMNGGTLEVSSSGGDGIDSNGYIVINGGTLTSKSGGGADNGLDSDEGVYIASSGAIVYTDGVENYKTATGYTGSYTTIQGNGNKNGQRPNGAPPGQNGDNSAPPSAPTN